MDLDLIKKFLNYLDMKFWKIWNFQKLHVVIIQQFWLIVRCSILILKNIFIQDFNQLCLCGKIIKSSVLDPTIPYIIDLDFDVEKIIGAWSGSFFILSKKVCLKLYYLLNVIRSVCIVMDQMKLFSII